MSTENQSTPSVANDLLTTKTDAKVTRDHLIQELIKLADAMGVTLEVKSTDGELKPSVVESLMYTFPVLLGNIVARMRIKLTTIGDVNVEPKAIPTPDVSNRDGETSEPTS